MYFPVAEIAKKTKKETFHSNVSGESCLQAAIAALMKAARSLR
jgi:hypothetical protein